MATVTYNGDGTVFISCGSSNTITSNPIGHQTPPYIDGRKLLLKLLEDTEVARDFFCRITGEVIVTVKPLGCSGGGPAIVEAARARLSECSRSALKLSALTYLLQEALVALAKGANPKDRLFPSLPATSRPLTGTVPFDEHIKFMLAENMAILAREEPESKEDIDIMAAVHQAIGLNATTA